MDNCAFGAVPLMNTHLGVPAKRESRSRQRQTNIVFVKGAAFGHIAADGVNALKQPCSERL